jgi:putative salt-induced outer membrane protein YdiY
MKVVVNTSKVTGYQAESGNNKSSSHSAALKCKKCVKQQVVWQQGKFSQIVFDTDNGNAGGVITVT